MGLPQFPLRTDARYYGAVALDENEVLTSTSGGVASVLARKFVREGGSVLGAAFDPFPFVRHIHVKNEKDIDRIKGSKYVESDVKEAIRKASECLSKGRRVLFIGLPCQIAALYAFLKGDDENLVTVDLICHGKPPQKLFNVWVAELEKRLHGKIVAYKFRNKIECCWNDKETHIHQYLLSDGRCGAVPAKLNWYSRYFLGSASFNEGCYRCPFAKIPRIGDITLGDFWGCEKDDRFSPYLRKGVSLVSVQSRKGEVTLRECDAMLALLPVERGLAIKANKQLTMASKRPIYRSFIFHYVYGPRIVRFVCDKLLFSTGRLVHRLLKFVRGRK